MTAPTAPVRRSPLEGVLPVATTDLTLRELALLDKVVARGIGRPEVSGRVIEVGSVAIWHLGPDEAIVISRRDAATEAARVLAVARSQVDMSSGIAALRVGGGRARALLAEACPVDLSEIAVADRGIVQGMVANVRVVIARMDVDREPAFMLLVARDEARYLWDALSEVGGLGPGSHD